MNWKVDENGAIVVKEGNPVYTDSNGDEKTVMVDTISRLNKEAMQHRVAKEEALGKLRDFEGLDAKQAREALEKMSKVEQKQLIDAGKIDEVKNQITTQYQAQLSEKETALQTLQSRYNNMVVDNVFGNSRFIRDNVAVPRDLFEAKFKQNFKVENGEVVVIGNDGNRLYSKERAGEYATPEEGLRILAESHPDKEVILRANVGTGSGSTGNAGGQGGGRYIKRSDFEKLSPVQQTDYAAKIVKGEMKMTD